jgi:titin
MFAPDRPARRAPTLGGHRFRPHLEGLEDRTAPAVLMVTNTLDTGPGSLRQAILDANATPGTDTIAFNIPGAGPHVITTTAALAITDPVNLDATTQPGYAGTPVIDVTGGNPFPAVGLLVTANLCTVRGLELSGFTQYGLEILGGSGSTVAGCVFLSNFAGGVALSAGANHNVIGGATPAAANVASNNGSWGVVVFGQGATGNVIQGDFLGTDLTGTLSEPNGFGGAVVAAGAAGNFFYSNVMSANSVYGLVLSDPGTAGNTVAGNLIGVSKTGAKLANGFAGVGFGNGASSNTLGGAVPGAANVISSNGYDGVYVGGSTTTGNVLQDNLIGVGIDGAFALPNGAFGVAIQDGAGATSLGGNVVGFHPQAEVLLDNSTGNNLISNRVGVTATGGNAGSTGPGIWLRDGSPRNYLAGNIVGNHDSGGVQLDGAGTTQNTLQGNILGLNGAGAVAGNGFGVLIENGASGNLVGGPTGAVRNLISANSGAEVGIFGATTTGNIVQSNFLGTNAAGTAAAGPAPGGFVVDISSPGNLIGGDGAGNVISGHAGVGVGGIRITGSGASGNMVYGNFIGTDVTGTAAIPNGFGIAIQGGAHDNLIGGTTGTVGNVISANTTEGLLITNAGTTGNLVRGNRIGVGAGGAALANGIGILIASGASNNRVGGTTPGAGNIIADNTQKGVVIGSTLSDTTTVGDAVLGNSIFGNGGLGIDLASDGVTANTAGGPHTGPNDFQNFPVLSLARLVGTTLLVTGTLNSQASTTYRVELFASPQADPTGHGQGQTYLGYTTVTTDGPGNASFAAVVPFVGPAGSVVSATATAVIGTNTVTALASGDTSEFSGDITVS